MSNKNNPRNTPLAQKLRKEMTKEERHLWYDFLKKLPFDVKRQKTIGNYIVDFYCPSKKIAIELDGEQHYSEKGIRHDIERDAYLESQRIQVLRYSNHDVNTVFDGVCLDIYRRLTGQETTPQKNWMRGVITEEERLKAEEEHGRKRLR